MSGLFFNEYPYTDFHQLNLSWVINDLQELRQTIEQFVSINALKYADPIQWNITTQYEKNTIVIDPQTGTAYISVQPVPSGVSLANTDYWTVVFDLGSFVTRAAKNFTSRYEEETTTTATFATSTGEWLVWGDTLYRALVNITAGDQYVVGSNIQQITVEEIKNEIMNTMDALYTEISDRVGDLADLTTSDVTSIVNAINSIITERGSLSNLTTSDVASIVGAINSIITERGSLSNLTTSDVTSIVGAINSIITERGDLNDLNTTDKTSIVNAINEVLASSKIVVASDFTGADDTAILQAAIDSAISNRYDTIIIDREFDIDNTLYIDKGLYYTDSDYLRYRSKLTFLGVNNGKIKKSNSGYFFSANTYSGDIAFINVTFEGDVVLDNNNDIANKANGNSVFDCHSLIRLTTMNCSYTLVGCVFDGRDTTDNSNNMQSNYNFGDTCTYSGAYYYVNRCWDVHIIGCIIENCNYGFKANNSASIVCLIEMVNIVDCCIETCVLGAIDCRSVISDGDVDIQITNFNVKNCYFESNGTSDDNTHIDLNCTLSGSVIDSCRFAITSNGEKCIWLRVKTQGTTVSNNCCTGSYSGRFLYVELASGATIFTKVLALNNDPGSLSTTNDTQLVNNTVLTIPEVAYTPDQISLSDANDLEHTIIVRITSSDSVSNLPSGETDGILISQGATNVMQMFVNTSGVSYMRARLSGIGFTSWSQISN